MARGRSEKLLTERVERGRATRHPDEVVVEEPLEIRLDEALVATTMRTPGNDFELAAGFCFTEGLLHEAPVLRCRYCGTGGAAETGFNVVTVETGGKAPTPEPRLGPTTSSCGICGAASLEDLTRRLRPLPAYESWAPDVFAGAPGAVRDHQELFAVTGGVHAAAVIDRQGEVGGVREDIGRHNAVDKVVGALLFAGGLPASDRALFVSGRASFEMVQKAWAGGFEAVVAVSAPSALAVQTARTAGLTLAGFVREGALNVYTRPDLPT